MGKIPAPSDIILVAIIPTLRDFDIARLLGWYRMPLKSAPKIIEVDYLAFYQTNAFGVEHRWRIESFAEVRGHELTTRRELLRDEPEHPRAHEEYFKVQLGELQTMARPILAKDWLRITFFYTTGELFRTAEFVNELVVRDDERDILWKTLRERALQGGRYGAQELDELAIDAALLAMLGGFDHLAEEPIAYDVD